MSHNQLQTFNCGLKEPPTRCLRHSCRCPAREPGMLGRHRQAQQVSCTGLRAIDRCRSRGTNLRCFWLGAVPSDGASNASKGLISFGGMGLAASR